MTAMGLIASKDLLGLVIELVSMEMLCTTLGESVGVDWLCDLGALRVTFPTTRLLALESFDLAGSACPLAFRRPLRCGFTLHLLGGSSPWEARGGHGQAETAFCSLKKLRPVFMDEADVFRCIGSSRTSSPRVRLGDWEVE